MNNKPWYKNNTLEKFQERTYDALGNSREDKDYTETWWFKKPYDYFINFEDEFEDDPRWKKSVENLSRVFRKVYNGNAIRIPINTQIDFLEIDNTYVAWYYLNNDKSLKIVLSADTWNEEISPILGKKLSDVEKQARLDKIAANKAAKAAEVSYWRLGNGDQTVVFNRPYEGIFGVSIKNNQGLQRGEQITFSSKEKAEEFIKEAFPGMYLYAYKVKKTDGDHYNYVPVQTQYGEVLASEPYYEKWKSAMMDKKGDRVAAVKAIIWREVSEYTSNYYWASFYDRKGKLDPKKLASEIKKYPFMADEWKYPENLLDQIEKRLKGSPLKDIIRILSKYYQYLNPNPKKNYEEVVNYLKNHRDIISSGYRKVIDSL